MERRMKEKIKYDHNENKITINRTFDVAPVIEQNKLARDMGKENFGDSKFVGRVPMYLIEEWCKEAGLQPHDTDARKEVLRKKLLSGEFDKLRVWKGNY